MRRLTNPLPTLGSGGLQPKRLRWHMSQFTTPWSSLGRRGAERLYKMSHLIGKGKIFGLPRFLPRSETTISSSPQVDEQNDHCCYQENMNQAAGNMIAVAQEPKDQEDRENCPKHFFLFLRTVAPGREHPQVPQCAYNGTP
jgi:hypothetical protein